MLLQADPTVKFGLQEFGLKRIPVSYTHLDVYKRQQFSSGPFSFSHCTREKLMRQVLPAFNGLLKFMVSA